MSKYVGHKCIVCELEFKAEDDVVVCPECGTPYHRSCYMSSGECVNKELHESGESWNSSREKGNNEDSGPEPKKCPYCEFVNKPHCIICERCGSPLVDELKRNMYGQGDTQTDGNLNSGQGNDTRGQRFTFDYADKYCGFDPEEEFEAVKLKEISEFVNKNQIYYLPIFKKIKDTGKKISLNVISFFFPEIYFANRKMWFWSVLSIIISLALSFPNMLYMLAYERMIGTTIAGIDLESVKFDLIYSISSYAALIFKVLMLMFANYIYYRHTLNKIRRKKAVDELTDISELSRAGGTSAAGAIMSIAAETAVMLIVMLVLVKIYGYVGG